MADTPAATTSALSPRRARWGRSLLLVALTVLFVLAVRLHLREMPLERDEGEYAYAGQLILQGVPPYKEAYNMKLPGTYAAYAVIMALFGQSPAGIHFGVALVNAASVLLVFLIGKRILDAAAGGAAAVTFALLSLSPSVLGLAGHATHFVVLPALGGTWLLLRAWGERRAAKTKSHRLKAEVEEGAVNEEGGQREELRASVLFGSGLLFGLALLMKQHGVFFGVCGGLCIVWIGIYGWFATRAKVRGAIPKLEGRRSEFRSPRSEARYSRPGADAGLPQRRGPAAAVLMQLSVFGAGMALPYAVTCLVLWGAGVFHQFVFWTISYAARYAAAVPLMYGADVLRDAMDVVVGPNILFWILPWVGAVVMWWEDRLHVNSRFFLTAFALCSFASVCVGFAFRNHYFITLLPALALLTGVAVSRGVHLLRHDKTIELFVAVPTLILFIVGVGSALIGNGSVWFATPARAISAVYRTTLFPEALKLAQQIKSETGTQTRIAVIGSEPEIYFYARRRSATGYIYTYPLMEHQDFALRMQREMIAEIERARPEYVVYVNDDLSWLARPNSERMIYDWWKNYWAANLDLVKMIKIDESFAEVASMDRGEKSGGEAKYLMLLKRRAGAPAVEASQR